MAIAKRLDDIESIIRAKKNNSGSTVFGVFRPYIEDDVIHPDKAIHVKSVKLVNGDWVDTDEEYLATISEKALPALTSKKRFIGLIGGRGSGKSEGESQKCVAKMHDNGEKVACFREFQNSIDDSVYSSLEGYIGKWNMSGFKCNNGHIKHASGGEAKFRGIARNPDSIKSMNGFKTFWVEEAQASSENSLKLLTPTMREKGGQIVFTANPGSSEDPFSKRFITPFKSDLDANDIFEDNLHLIVKINWRDNPWFPESLNQERMWDYEHLPRALYDHIWEGEFNDSIDNALVMAEWFDACIDAHLKIDGFNLTGNKKLTHDPSDLGKDPKAIAIRHGNVFTHIEERADLDVNDGEIVSLIGSNGAGKSTLLMTISGVNKARRGNIVFNGENIENKDPHKIVDMGICQVPEGRRIFSRLTVEENLRLGAHANEKGKHFENDIKEVYDLFPVLSDRKTQRGGTLSGGEQQMLAIGRALMSKPKVLLLDEPSLGIAP